MEEGRSRGARLLYLDTFSFHALDFYLAQDYEIACQFEGHPRGAILYILRKSLADA